MTVRIWGLSKTGAHYRPAGWFGDRSEAPPPATSSVLAALPGADPPIDGTEAARDEQITRKTESEPFQWDVAARRSSVTRLFRATCNSSARLTLGGVPYKIRKTRSVCHLYLDIRITPAQTLLSVERELRDVLEGTGIPATIEPFDFRRGYEAQGVEPLVAKVEAAHRASSGRRRGGRSTPLRACGATSNVFSEAGIPTVVYGPGASVGGGNFAMAIDALVQAAKAYAAIVIDVCATEQDTSKGGRA